MAWVVRPGPGKQALIPVLERKPVDLPSSSTTPLVKVKMQTSALNHRDNWITKRLYPGIREGCTLGADGCGVALNGKHKGDTVVIDPSLGWGADDRAPNGTLEILGTPRDGCFADAVVVPEANVYPKPAHLSLEEAAALPLAGVTAYRALLYKGFGNQRPAKGTRVLVTGIGGGVAVFAAQFAAALDCDVYVTSSSAAKLAKAKRLIAGCKGGVLYTEAQWSKSLLKLTSGGKFQVVIDGAGGDGIAECLKCLQGGGRFVSYGSTAGPTGSAIALPMVFLNNLEILGTAMGSPSDFANMLALVNEKKIKPVVDEVFAFKDFPLALDKMRVGGQLGKLVLDHRVARL
jgi:zinc-binding alcohol dehydrogenase/oxidoreductase